MIRYVIITVRLEILMYIAIMGYGVVGSGAAEVLKTNNEKICFTSGQEKMELKYILDLRSFPGDPNEKLVTNDFNVILNDPEVEIVIETMGGLHPAYDFVLSTGNFRYCNVHLRSLWSYV